MSSYYNEPRALTAFVNGCPYYYGYGFALLIRFNHLAFPFIRRCPEYLYRRFAGTTLYGALV
jgi:hypothetical protein